MRYTKRILEKTILSELIKSYLFRGKQPSFYYFRDKEGHEVDLIIEANNEIHLIEIKLTAQIKDEHMKNLNYVSKLNENIKSKTIISLVKEHLKVKDNVQYIPYTYVS